MRRTKALADQLWPFIVACLAIAGILLLELGPNDASVQLTFFCITLQQPLKSILIVKCLLAVIAVVGFVFALNRDYAGYFPTHFRMHVFFHDAAVSKALARLSKAEIAKIGIEPNWPELKKSTFSLCKQG